MTELGNLPFDNPREAAAEVKARAFLRFRLLPFNRFDADRSRYWWLCPPGAGSPAFPNGKAIFATDEAWVSEGQVFCGFAVEKGLPPGASRPSEVLTPSWFWNRFVSMPDADFVRPIREAAEAGGSALEVVVAAGPLVPGAEWARVTLHAGPDALRLTSHVEADGALGQVAAAKDPAELRKALAEAATGPAAWHWIDVLIGRTFSLDADGADDTERCVATLDAFRGWML